MGDKAQWVAVTAPVSGVAERARHGAGDWVSAQDELASVAEIDDVVAELNLPEALALKFQHYLGRTQPAGAQAQRNIQLVLPDGSLYAPLGTVANVVTRGSVNTMQIYFSNPAHVLRPGEFVKVRSAAP
jgi:hypothetical protein